MRSTGMSTGRPSVRQAEWRRCSVAARSAMRRKYGQRRPSVLAHLPASSPANTDRLGAAGGVETLGGLLGAAEPEVQLQAAFALGNGVTDHPHDNNCTGYGFCPAEKCIRL